MKARKSAIPIQGRHADLTVPVDMYIEYTTRTFDIEMEALQDEDFSLAREPYSDEYSSGGQYTCIHCNTAFKSMRREPKCPFCHKRPL